MTRLVDIAVAISRSLPRADVSLLAGALLRPNGLDDVQHAAGVQLRAACAQLRELVRGEHDRAVVAGVLLGSLVADPTAASITPVWTGPLAGAVRLTSAVVAELIGSATSNLLLVGYAVHSEPMVRDALRQAQHRGVAITLVLERAADNPGFRAGGTPFVGLTARRLHWPSPPRPPGASLHAKVLVIDDDAALVGSANITGAALDSNLECGLLVRGGSTASNLRGHVETLLERGDLTATPA